jgi:hypothetical protein
MAVVVAGFPTGVDLIIAFVLVTDLALAAVRTIRVTHHLVVLRVLVTCYAMLSASYGYRSPCPPPFLGG